jgi:type II secretory pathway component PulC
MLLLGNLWFVNSFLLIFSLSIFSYLGFFNVQKHEHFHIKKPLVDESIIQKKELTHFNAITDKDIFSSMPAIPDEEQKPHTAFYPAVSIVPIPPTPAPVPLVETEDTIQDFLPPLQVILKGTIISNNPKYNRAFIENMRSKEEKSYMIGDIVDDAQIVSIEKTKIILIRSNGQQEILYITNAAAQEENALLKMPWNKIIFEGEDNYFLIDVRLLKKRISTPGHFFDELDLVTFFENGIPIGCQIGRQETDSLATALGLIVNDTIISVDSIGTATGDSRAEIYEKLFNYSYSEPVLIEVVINRNGKTITHTYELFMSSIQQYKKNLGILMFENEKNIHDVDFKKEIIHNHATKSSLNKDKLHDMIEDEEKALTKRGGKEHAYYRT